MSELPYFFDTPVPKFFRENGWFKNENMYKFITWAFSKCSTVPQKKNMYGKEFTLAPFEFVAGRLTDAAECFLSESAFRATINQLIEARIIARTANSITNRFTCYIWITERFCKTYNQQKGQQTTNASRHQPRTDSQPIYTKNTDKKKKKKKNSACAILFNRETSQFENIADTDKLEWQTIYPNVDIDRELLKMRQWLLDPKNPHRDGNRTFVNNWLARSHKTAPLAAKPVAENDGSKPDKHSFYQWLSVDKNHALDYLKNYPKYFQYFNNHNTLEGIL